MTQSMRELFRQHHRLTDAERSALWATCTFALDANVLLNIYRYADSTRDDLFKVLERLAGRVWVPFQAAREFYRNRIDVIQEQRAKYTELQAELERAVTSLRGGAFRKSAFLRLDQIEEVLRPAVDRAKQVVEQQREEHPNLIQDDVYLERLAAIVGTSVGVEPDQATFDKRCTEAQVRIDRSQPPGFRDAKKPIPDRYGDVLVWYELLDRAEATKQPVVFVTDDDKEDWWQIVAGQKLGPRPELREEMRKRAGVEFHIYNPAFLLQTAGQQLDLAVAESSVDDAATVAAQLQEQLRTFTERTIQQASFTPRPERSTVYAGRWIQETGRAAEEAVYRWLLMRTSAAEIIRLERGPFDFIVDESSRRVAVDVKLFRPGSAGSTRIRLRDASVRAFYEISQGRVDDYHIYLVSPDEDSALRIARLVLGGPVPEPAYTVSVGFLDPDGEYIEIGRESWGRAG